MRIIIEHLKNRKRKHNWKIDEEKWWEINSVKKGDF